MRHQKAFRKLGRDVPHRKALLRNLATSLVLNDKIETTLPRAKELKRVADKLVTLGKKNSLHARRVAMQFLFEINKHEEGNAQKRTAVHRLFTEISPRYSERNGGYTRVVRTRKRAGDNAQLAVIEFVESELKSQEPKRKKRRVKKEEAPAVSKEVEQAEEVVSEEASS